MKKLLCSLLLLSAGISLWACGLRVALVGDPQVDNETELSYARRSIFQELRARKDLDFVLVLGDLVNDRPDLLAPCIASLDSLSCPWICVPGNHDKDVYRQADSQKGGKALPYRPRDLRTFRSLLGYEDTTFVLQGVRFICMDNVRIRNKADYEGGFRESQKNWLDSIVRMTPERQLLVFCTHIPLSVCKGKDSLSVILGAHRKTFLVSAHAHSVIRHRYAFCPDSLSCAGAQWMELEELVAGATCGSWWRGLKDRHGIPSATMRSGDPRGYFIADFQGGRLKSLSYKVVGETVRASATRRDSVLLVNVYGGSKMARVLIRRAKGCGKWMEMTPSQRVSPEVQAVVEFNASLDRQYKKTHREEIIPLRNYPCEHLWEIPAAEMGDGDVLIKYDDGPYRFSERLPVL